MDNIFFDLNTFDELIESLKQKYKGLEIINENLKCVNINIYAKAGKIGTIDGLKT